MTNKNEQNTCLCQSSKRNIYLCCIGVMFLFVGYVFVLACRQECVPGDGEHILITENNCKSVKDKMDRLCDLAVFPSRRVRWHIPLIGATLASACLAMYITYCHVPCTISGWFFTILVPTFTWTYITTQYLAYHGPTRKHCDFALQIRKELSCKLGC